MAYHEKTTREVTERMETTLRAEQTSEFKDALDEWTALLQEYHTVKAFVLQEEPGDANGESDDDRHGKDNMDIDVLELEAKAWEEQMDVDEPGDDETFSSVAVCGSDEDDPTFLFFTPCFRAAVQGISDEMDRTNVEVLELQRQLAEMSEAYGADCV